MNRRLWIYSASFILIILATGIISLAYTGLQESRGLRRDIDKLRFDLLETNQMIAKAVEDIGSIKLRVGLVEFQTGSPGRVDLTKTIFQSLEDQFSIAISNVTKHLTGIQIKGQILNGQAVTHEQAEFKVSIGAHSNEFTIRQVRPGYAANFVVYIPDVKVEETRFARFSYQKSTLSYFNEP